MKGWWINTKAALKVAFLLCLPIALVACSQSSQRLHVMVPEKQIYKHHLVVTGDARIIEQFSKELKNTDLWENITFSHSPQPGNLQLDLTLDIITHRDERDLPAFSGKLTKQHITPEYVLRYTLMGADGKMVAASEVRHKSQMRTVYMPQLNSQSLLAPSDDDVKYLTQHTAEALVPIVQSQPWRARVISVIEPYHVVIAAGEASGLRYGDMFTTETLPVAELQVVTLDTTPEGEARATLRLIMGVLPEAGRAVVPSSKTR